MTTTLTHRALADLLGPDTGYAADIAKILDDITTGEKAAWPVARLQLLANRLTNLSQNLAEGGVRIR